MRIANFILAIMFMVFAFLQINDPDPVIWILIYGTMAVICILAAFEFYRIKILVPLMIIFFAYSITFLPGVREWLSSDEQSALFDNLAKMKYSFIEESREFLGLFICVAVLIFYTIRAKRRTVKN